MPHLHLSLQSGDDLILKRMKRQAPAGHHAVELCERVRSLRPDTLFGADLIAGFPTESEESFENSLRLVEDCGLTFLHVFPFSPRGRALRRRACLSCRASSSRNASARLARGWATSWFSCDPWTLSSGRARRLLVERGGFARTPSFAPCRLDAVTRSPACLIEATAP